MSAEVTGSVDIKTGEVKKPAVGPIIGPGLLMPLALSASPPPAPPRASSIKPATEGLRFSPICAANLTTKAYYRALLLGEPGSGKTICSLMTLPPDFYPLAVVDHDNKDASMPELRPFIDDGRIVIYPINEPLMDVEWMIEKAKTADAGEIKHFMLPRGFIKAVEITNYLMGFTREAKVDREAGVFPVYRTLVHDTLSRMAEHIERTTEFVQKSIGLAGWGDWEKYRAYLEEFFDNAVVQAPMHVIVNCHIYENVKKGKAGNETSYWTPAINGKMRKKMLSYFNEAYLLKTTRGAQGAVNYVMRTKKTDVVPARTNIVGLGEEVKQDLGVIIGMWKKQMGFDEVGMTGEK